MRLFPRMIILVAVAIAMVFMGTGLCSAKIIPGKPAPLFSLKDVKGRTYKML